MASTAGDLIAIGFGSGVSLVVTKRFATRGAPTGQWISPPDALRSRPTLQSGRLLFAVGAVMALVYALSHAAATTLLSHVRTVFNETMPGQYSVGRRFDVAALALASVTT